MTSEIMLHAVGVDKSFGPTHAVDHVSLDMRKGEIHALIGENGSGKSTFTNMLVGILPIDEGSFELDGLRIAPRSQVEANHLGAAVIVQEQGTLDGLSVAENMFLGDEDQFMSHGIKNTAAMNRKAQELLDSYGMEHIRAVDPIENYTFEDRKLVEIVKSTWFRPKVLVVDETTTALSENGRRILFDVMRKVRDDGRTVIFICHDMSEILMMSDSISILRDGEYVCTVKASEVDEDRLKTLMVGRDLTDQYYREDYGEPLTGEVALSMRHVSVPGQLEDVSIELHKGEILGIGGLSECGMHEVGKALFGASYERTGEVVLGDGTPIGSIATAISHSIGYASKDRDNESLLINDTIQDNITLPSLRKMGLPLHPGALRDFADRHATAMSTKMVGVSQFVSDLSGGNKQKVVLARWLGAESDILILDSPTRGIDIRVKADIYALMNKMRRQGKAILVISEEIVELIGMCDRILVMKDRKIAGELERSRDLTEQDIISMMI